MVAPFLNRKDFLNRDDAKDAKSDEKLTQSRKDRKD